MRELINDPFYELIKKYKRCIIDYCLIEADSPYQGYRSHKDAVWFAMCKVNERDMEEMFPWSMDITRTKGESISPALLLHAPNIIERDKCGHTKYDCQVPDPTQGEQIPYWYAFWNTPHGTGYGAEEFHAVNDALFPNGARSLEVYEWTTDWSSYFDAGHEWWGAACWSVYDNSLNRFVVILASTTD